MENTNELLDEVKRRHKIGSDYALAKRLGITRSVVSAYRTGKRNLGEDVAVTVADLLDVDPGYVLACMEAERTTHPAARAAWERMADLVKRHGAAAIFVLAAAPLALYPESALADTPQRAVTNQCILC